MKGDHFDKVVMCMQNFSKTQWKMVLFLVHHCGINITRPLASPAQVSTDRKILVLTCKQTEALQALAV